MSSTLGPLPEPEQTSLVSDSTFRSYELHTYTTSQMEAERLRCFDLGVSKASELWHSTVFAWWDSAREAACDMTATEHFAWVKVGELLRQPRVTPNVQPARHRR